MNVMLPDVAMAKYQDTVFESIPEDMVLKSAREA